MTDERPEDDITEEALTSDAWSDGAVDDPEVPEADALDQARVVGGSEDEDYEPGPSEPPME